MKFFGILLITCLALIFQSYGEPISDVAGGVWVPVKRAFPWTTAIGAACKESGMCPPIFSDFFTRGDAKDTTKDPAGTKPAADPPAPEAEAAPAK